MAGLATTFGSGAMTNSIGEIRNADCILVIGSNTTENHPVISLRVKEAVRQRGAKLIVADPRRIDLVDFAHLWLGQKPGTDAALSGDPADWSVYDPRTPARAHRRRPDRPATVAPAHGRPYGILDRVPV